MSSSDKREKLERLKRKNGNCGEFHCQDCPLFVAESCLPILKSREISGNTSLNDREYFKLKMTLIDEMIDEVEAQEYLEKEFTSETSN